MKDDKNLGTKYIKPQFLEFAKNLTDDEKAEMVNRAIELEYEKHFTPLEKALKRGFVPEKDHDDYRKTDPKIQKKFN